MKRRVTRIHIAAMVISGLFAEFAGLTDHRAMACDCQRPGSPREELQRVTRSKDLYKASDDLKELGEGKEP